MFYGNPRQDKSLCRDGEWWDWLRPQIDYNHHACEHVAGAVTTENGSYLVRGAARGSLLFNRRTPHRVFLTTLEEVATEVDEKLRSPYDVALITEDKLKPAAVRLLLDKIVHNRGLVIVAVHQPRIDGGDRVRFNPFFSLFLFVLLFFFIFCWFVCWYPSRSGRCFLLF